MNNDQEKYIELMSKVALCSNRLSMKTLESIANKVEHVEYKKNDVLQTEGEIAEWLYVISEGIIREHGLRSDGLDVIIALHEARTGTGSLNSYEERVGCVYSLSAVTPAKAYRIKCSDYLNLIETDHELSIWYGKQLRQSCVNMQKHIMDISCRSGEERLEYLLRERSNLFDKVPQYQLANFLNMTPVSFSRSKKKIMRKLSLIDKKSLKDEKETHYQRLGTTLKQFA
ncbi:MAG: Crp/Fnr family transcriptional regulator [Cellvibrionaceae bacterium]